jgi:hypothetical protein
VRCRSWQSQYDKRKKKEETAVTENKMNRRKFLKGVAGAVVAVPLLAAGIDLVSEDEADPTDVHVGQADRQRQTPYTEPEYRLWHIPRIGPLVATQVVVGGEGPELVSATERYLEFWLPAGEQPVRWQVLADQLAVEVRTNWNRTIYVEDGGNGRIFYEEHSRPLKSGESLRFVSEGARMAVMSET